MNNLTDSISPPQTFTTRLTTTTGFTESSGSDELLAGDCTSCAVTEDKSAYWTPPMYFKDAATGQYKIVDQVGGMLS